MMQEKENIQRLEELVTRFITLVSKRLPDDVSGKLSELQSRETNPMAQAIYQTMFDNIELALALDRPVCQDTGVLQFFLRAGTGFPYLGAMETVLRNAVRDATVQAPLRHNAVETFDEFNTGDNTGRRVPWVDWEVVPGDSGLSMDVYMAGGGCTLPGTAKVLMPSAGYEGIVDYVLDAIVSYGVNACPPLLVGVGIATSVDTAAVLSKKALMRKIGSRNPNAKAAKLEALLTDGINRLGIGPQGLSGDSSVMDVHVEHAARHPSAIGVAINVGCWAHRRGSIRFAKDLSYEILTHKGVAL